MCPHYVSDNWFKNPTITSTKINLWPHLTFLNWKKDDEDLHVDSEHLISAGENSYLGYSLVNFFVPPLSTSLPVLFCYNLITHLLVPFSHTESILCPIHLMPSLTMQSKISLAQGTKQYEMWHTSLPACLLLLFMTLQIAVEPLQWWVLLHIPQPTAITSNIHPVCSFLPKQNIFALITIGSHGEKKKSKTLCVDYFMFSPQKRRGWHMTGKKKLQNWKI